MQMPSHLTPCELKIPSPRQQNLEIGPSMALASFMVANLSAICFFGSMPLLVFFSIVTTVSDASDKIMGYRGYFLVFFVVYHIGVAIVFRKGCPRLVSMLMALIDKISQCSKSSVKVKLTGDALQLQNEEVQLVINWDDVEAITENEQDFRIELLNKPDVYLPKQELPTEWQSGLADCKIKE